MKDARNNILRSEPTFGFNIGTLLSPKPPCATPAVAVPAGTPPTVVVPPGTPPAVAMPAVAGVAGAAAGRGEGCA